MEEEKICIPKSEYEKMIKDIKLLRELQKIDFELVKQFKESLEDVKSGRINKVA